MSGLDWLLLLTLFKFSGIYNVPWWVWTAAWTFTIIEAFIPKDRR